MALPNDELLTGSRLPWNDPNVLHYHLRLAFTVAVCKYVMSNSLQNNFKKSLVWANDGMLSVSPRRKVKFRKWTDEINHLEYGGVALCDTQMGKKVEFSVVESLSKELILGYLWPEG